MRKKMAYEYSDLTTDINRWTQQAVDQGWIDQEIALSFEEGKDVSANELFTTIDERPLVVAFMGGTGVGKSSLLNKLAGQAIARTGVERPTSREVTLYYHHSVSLSQLEKVFPLQQIQLSQHSDESSEKIIWIDMPDFDSTEEKNKDIVMQWLSYVDILIYVVSPERYRDNKAWQLLLSEGASHAWLFVMNQWDRGEVAQFEDFKRQLAKAGFDNPHIFKTISIGSEGDELPQLKTTIEAIATNNTVKQLEHRGLQQKKHHLKLKLQACLNSLGNVQDFTLLSDYQETSWKQTEALLVNGFEWPIKQTAIVCSQSKISKNTDKIDLWDDWAQSRFNDYLDNLILNANQKGLASVPFRKQLSEIRHKAEQIFHTQTELGCRQSLVNPGNVIQRAVIKLAHICEFILPLIAMTVVGFQVFQGYYDSSLTHTDYLGVDFVVHSLLLILLTWLLPYFLRKKMQPSMEKAALKGLNKGLDVAMTTIGLDIQQSIDTLKKQYQKTSMALAQLIEASEQHQTSSSAEQTSEELGRMLIE
jgi:energy-coupling factor transporter ATP-binding protein EcfA2